MINFNEEWRTYPKIVEKIEKINGILGIFPNKESLKIELKELREQLFESYEGASNRNNSINKTVLENVMRKWFKENCKFLNPSDVESNIIQFIPNAPIVSTIADNVISQRMIPFCSSSKCKDCPHASNPNNPCARKLMAKIVQSSERYTHIPNTEENYNLFLNGATNYLKKEISKQEITDSPIEAIMFDALKYTAKKYGLFLDREYPVYDRGRAEIRYSLDIVFLDPIGNIVLDIETDGLGFHNGFSNMANDRARDRWLLIRGIPTMRFTSKDIFSDLDNCIVQVDSALSTVCKWKNLIQ